MSITHEEPFSSGGTGHQRFVRALRVVAALSACVAILALWSAERAGVPHDLQLAAATRARPGETIALRALLFRDVDAPEGPTLASATAQVRLLDAHGAELASTPLVSTPLTTLDGALTLPVHLFGQLVLEATARFEGKTLSCRRALIVDEHAAPDALRGREAGPLQQLAVSRITAASPAASPQPFLIRVVGGACVPEQPCTLMVWVGAPAAAITARPGPTVVVEKSADPPVATEGIVSLTVRVHGPDAQLTLVAHRGDAQVAERSVRLPVALGEVGLFTPKSIVAPASVSLRYALPPGRDDVLVDVFADGRWRASQVIQDPRDSARTLDAHTLPMGLVRIQARTDRFTADGAGARVLYVRAPGEDELTALERIARVVARDEAGAYEPTATWARGLPPFARDDIQRAGAFLLAPLEQLRASVPALASGRPAALQVLGHTKVKLRFGVASSLVLSALVIGLSIARRGLSAADEAAAILAEARGLQNISRSERFRERARVLLLVLAVASAFLAGALLIAAKPLWF